MPEDSPQRTNPVFTYLDIQQHCEPTSTLVYNSVVQKLASDQRAAPSRLGATPLSCDGQSRRRWGRA
jgi:hypothetical protein